MFKSSKTKNENVGTSSVSQEAADNQASTMDAYNNFNCIGCVRCVGCIDCIDCIDCKNCINCKGYSDYTGK